MPSGRSLSEKLRLELITQEKTEWSELIHPSDKRARSHEHNVQQKKPDTNEYISYISIFLRFKKWQN